MKDYKYCPICRSKLGKVCVEGRDRLMCVSCGWIHYRNPLPVVVCLAVNARREILLIKRNVKPCKGRWALPGGFIELHETPEAAGKRELFEETGLRSKAGRLIGLELQKSQMYGFVLVAGMEFIPKKGNIFPGDDASDARFIPLKKLPNIPFRSHRKLIKKYYRNM